MRLTNVMEHAVKAHITRLREESALIGEGCWCPLCRADMMAMALSSLPPRYATRRAALRKEEEHALTIAVHDQVVSAVHHVAQFPKHPKGAGIAAGEPVWVVNLPLEESFRAVAGMVRAHEGACDCWHCRCDAVAFALNRYPARYGVEHGGRIHFPETDRSRMREELAAFLELALRVVLTVPRHEFVTTTL